MMQFLVKRVTQKYDDPTPQPCEGAYPGKIVISRWEGDPPKLTPVWFIDVASLDDLMALINKEGRIIIDEGDDDTHKEIVLYDGYIE